MYVNSLLATLNARGSILGRGSRRRRAIAAVEDKEIAFPTAGTTTDTGGRNGVGGLSAFDASVHGAGIEVRLSPSFRFFSLRGTVCC